MACVELEKRTYRLVCVNSVSALAKDLSNEYNRNTAIRIEPYGCTVCVDQLLNFRLLKSFVGNICENCVGNSSVDVSGAMLFEKRRCACQGTRRFGQVIYHNDIFVIHIADHA